MYDPSIAPSPPSAPGAPRVATGRYVYLVTRLRNRQITMEEATELFAIQQAMIRQASAASATTPPPPSAASPTLGSPMPTSAEPPASMLSDDTLGLLLLALGAGAGILGAMGKRIRDEGRGSPANRTGPTP